MRVRPTLGAGRQGWERLMGSRAAGLPSHRPGKQEEKVAKPPAGVEKAHVSGWAGWGGRELGRPPTTCPSPTRWDPPTPGASGLSTWSWCCSWRAALMTVTVTTVARAMHLYSRPLCLRTLIRGWPHGGRGCDARKSGGGVADQHGAHRAQAGTGSKAFLEGPYHQPLHPRGRGRGPGRARPSRLSPWADAIPPCLQLAGSPGQALDARTRRQGSEEPSPALGMTSPPGAGTTRRGTGVRLHSTQQGTTEEQRLPESWEPCRLGARRPHALHVAGVCPATSPAPPDPGWAEGAPLPVGVGEA